MKLKTYEVLTDKELQNNIIKQQVIYRLENWLEFYIERYVGLYFAGEDKNQIRADAISEAKDELQDFDSFQKIDEQSELIDVDPLDEPEEYKYQMEIIKEWANNL